MLKATFLALLFLSITSHLAAAPPNKEKGPQCSDGIDNDGDGLIDAVDPDCGGGGGGSTSDDDVQYHVEVLTLSDGSDFPWSPEYPWSPDPGTCAAYTAPGGTGFRVRFPRHMQCVPECWIFLEEMGVNLTDDIALNLDTKNGQFTGFSINGQDTIGREGTMHESDVVPLDQVIPENPDAVFEIPIYSDISVYRLKGHLSGRRVGLAGVIQIGKLIYTPCGESLPCPLTWPVEEPECPQ